MRELDPRIAARVYERLEELEPSLDHVDLAVQALAPFVEERLGISPFNSGCDVGRKETVAFFFETSFRYQL